MSVLQISKSIWLNPGNRGKRLAKAAAALRWQLYKRTVRRPKTIKLPNRVKFRAYPDSVVSSALIYADWPEYHELKFCRSLLDEGELIIDIGANVGHMSLLLGDIVGSENVICFEPTPVSWRRLCENFELNGWSTSNLHQMAVGRAQGTVSMPDVTSPSTTNRVGAVDSSYDDVDVKVTSLDDFSQSIAPGVVGLLKIDVEGYEPEVFGGAKRFLATRRPKLILFESLSGSVHKEIEGALEAAGYRIFQLDNNGRPVGEPLNAQNLFAAPAAVAETMLTNVA